MTEIDTEAERGLIDGMPRSQDPEFRYLQENGRLWLNEIDRLQAENKRIGEERDSLASSLAIETGKYRDAWAENQRLRKHIQYYSYCTRQGVRATEASYIEWEEAHKSLGFDIP